MAERPSRGELFDRFVAIHPELKPEAVDYLRSQIDLAYLEGKADGIDQLAQAITGKLEKLEEQMKEGSAQ